MRYDSDTMEKVAQQFRREMWDSVVPEAVFESGVEMERFGPVLATAFCELPEFPLLQQIQGAAEPGAIAGGHLGAAIEWMRVREVDYRIPVAAGRPGAAEAEVWLDARGFERGSGWIKMVRDGSPPSFEVDPEILVYRLGLDEPEAEGMSTIAPEAFEMPWVAGALVFSLPQRNGWHCYTAALGPDQGPVATATMLIVDGVAQLSAGQTLEHARGLGCNAALLHQRLRDAHWAGCHTVFVEVGECDSGSWAAVTGNLVRAGFEEAYEGRNWQRPALHPAELPEQFSD